MSVLFSKGHFHLFFIKLQLSLGGISLRILNMKRGRVIFKNAVYQNLDVHLNSVNTTNNEIT